MRLVGEAVRTVAQPLKAWVQLSSLAIFGVLLRPAIGIGDPAPRQLARLARFGLGGPVRGAVDAQPTT